MYATCLFCTRPLGANETLETFPVGRRIAFDGARGRLWVVCRKCERWNLSPIEERWEAIEDCERLFRDTRTRVSTEHIGLARLTDGLELVRIGRPQRPEFAAWRYGDQFGRRRRRNILYTAGAAAVVGTIVIGGIATGAISGVFLGQTGNWINIWVNGRTLVRLRTSDGRVLKLKNPDLREARITPGDTPGGFNLAVGKGKRREVFEGEEAERVIGLVVPKLNSGGGNTKAVQEAVRCIETSGGPDAFFRSAVLDPAAAIVPGRKSTAGLIAKMPTAPRLALEMALHEERERRALEGELKLLEVAWREAEEVAAISDDLFLPPGAEQFIEEQRDRVQDPS